MSKDAALRPATDEPPPHEPPLENHEESCDVCGSADLWWRNCKLLCRRCRAIVKSCSDL